MPGRKRIYFSLLLICLCHAFVVSQNNKVIDSLENVLKQGQADTLRLKTLLKLAEKYIGNDPHQVIKNARLAIVLAEKLNRPKQKADAYSSMGVNYKNEAKYDSANFCHNAALVIFKQLNRKADISRVLNNLGIVQKELGNFNEALNYYIESLKLLDEKKDKKAIARTNMNIGIIYRKLGNTDKAMEYQLITQKLFAELKDNSGLSRVYANIGNLYSDKKEFKKALDYYLDAKKLKEGLGDKLDIATIDQSIGGIYSQTGDYKKAIEYEEGALKIYKEVNDQDGYAAALRAIGANYMEQKNYGKALNYMLESLDLSKKLGTKNEIKETYLEIAKTYKALGQFDKAFEYLDKYGELKDSILNQNMLTQINELDGKYQNEKKQKQIELLQKNEAIQDLELKRRNILIYWAVGVGIIILVFAMVSYKNFRIKKKTNLVLERRNHEIQTQKAVIEEKNKDILDSIRYAKRLQDAILPPQSLIHSHLPESFVLYKPKDIVSGDFYWVEPVGTKILFAAVDCTGHGVPGAIMSLIGHNLLNTIVKEKNILQPAAILNELLLDLMDALHQKTDDPTANDGMDIALCLFDKENMQLEYAGAFCPLLLVRDNELIEIKANKFSVGRQAYESKETFTNHSYKLLPGDAIYIFSDGYADQFGGEKGKKMMRKNQNKILLGNMKLSMAEQHHKLDRHFSRWKGQLEQVDDILIIGVRV